MSYKSTQGVTCVKSAEIKVTCQKARQVVRHRTDTEE